MSRSAAAAVAVFVAVGFVIATAPSTARDELEIAAASGNPHNPGTPAGGSAVLASGALPVAPPSDVLEAAGTVSDPGVAAQLVQDAPAVTIPPVMPPTPSSTTTVPPPPPEESPSEPPSASPSGALWSSGFEEPDWQDRWHLSMDGHPENRSVVAGIPGANGKAMRVFASKDNDGYTGFGAEMRSWLQDMGIAPRDEIVIRYSMYVPPTWNPYKGGKIPGMAGITRDHDIWESSQGGEYHEYSWSGRMMWLPPVDGNLDHARLTSYLYTRSAAGKSIYDNKNPANGRIYGIEVDFRQNPDYKNPWDRSRPLLHVKRGAWNIVEARYKMNTPGRSDGIFQGWLNGEIGVDLRDVQYRTTAHPDLNINILSFASFYGGPTANTTDQVWAFDDVALATSR